MPLNQCRFCDYYTKYNRDYYNHLHSHNTPDNVCKLSKEELQLCEYYHSKYIKHQSAYRQNNKDKMVQYYKEYYQNNKEQCIQKDKEYRQNNKDKIAQRKKEYRQNNKDKILQQKKEYRLKKKLEKQLQGKDIDDDEIIIEEN